jgi:hypothetical protein
VSRALTLGAFGRARLKQAAAQAIAVLEQPGYVKREADPGDTRFKQLRVTPQRPRDDDHRRGAL